MQDRVVFHETMLLMWNDFWMFLRRVWKPLVKGSQLGTLITDPSPRGVTPFVLKRTFRVPAALAYSNPPPGGARVPPWAGSALSSDCLWRCAFSWKFLRNGIIQSLFVQNTLVWITCGSYNPAIPLGQIPSGDPLNAQAVLAAVSAASTVSSTRLSYRNLTKR